MGLSFSWASFEGLVNVFIPGIVSSLVPGPGGLALGQLVAQGVTAVESQFGPASGAAKKAAVLATVTDAVNTMNAAKGTIVLDPTVTTAQVGAGIDLGIGIIHAVQALHAATPVVAVAPGLAAPPAA